MLSNTVRTISLFVCMIITYSRVWINRVWLPILLVVSWTWKINISLSPFAPWEFALARRVRPSCPASACSFSILRLNLVPTHGIPPDFRGGVHIFIPPTAIGSVPSFFAYRWRSLPRVCRHRALSPQDGFSNGCCLFRFHPSGLIGTVGNHLQHTY